MDTLERHGASTNQPPVETEAPHDGLIRAATDLAERDLRTRHALVAIRRARMDQRTLSVKLGRDVAWVQWFESYDADPRLSEMRSYALAIGARIEQTVVEAVR